jgi:Ricin-type beta-trefoil lectin domain
MLFYCDRVSYRLRHLGAFLSLALFLACGLASAHATDAPSRRIGTHFTGPTKCLDILNDGSSRPTMAPCGNFSGQAWQILPSETAGYVRFHTEFTGPTKCLDVVNGNQVVMDACGSSSGQLWSVMPSGSAGFSRLRTVNTGADSCLDIVNDGSNNKLTMSRCGDFSGQMWRISPPSTGNPTRPQDQRPPSRPGLL